MARKKQEKPPKYTIGRVFVGDRLLEDLTPEEREAFRKRTVQRIGDVMNNYFSLHPEVFAQVVRNAEQQEARA